MKIWIIRQYLLFLSIIRDLFMLRVYQIAFFSIVLGFISCSKDNISLTSDDVVPVWVDSDGVKIIDPNNRDDINVDDESVHGGGAIIDPNNRDFGMIHNGKR